MGKKSSSNVNYNKYLYCVIFICKLNTTQLCEDKPWYYNKFRPVESVRDCERPVGQTMRCERLVGDAKIMQLT